MIAPEDDPAATPADAGETAADADDPPFDPSMLLPDSTSDILGQDEIDSLLGLGVQAGRDESGIESLVNSATITYERLPLLEVAFDRLVRILTTSLRNFTSENVELSLDDANSIRFGEYLESLPLPAMIAVFRAVEWDNYGLITIDSPLIYSIVDVLLGGRRGTTPMRIEGRPFTSIERVLVERLVRLVLQEMSNAFEPLSKVEFRHERLETSPRFAAIARPTNACVLFRMRVDMDDRGGKIEILLPYATLEPVRDLLLQMFMGEKFGQDSIWETHLAREIMVTDVELEALLEEQTVPLSQILQLSVGMTLPLHARPGDLVTLRCGHVPMLRGTIGRVGEHIAIQVEERIRRQLGEP